ncbi:MAG: hypothetical protein MAG715_00243 [Methanonatronarchaeales archaeon]|nr:hypothetical protein [Methanonatronarchaeales archaeon]
MASKPEMVKVTSKGQITIPSALRRSFDLEEGDQLLALPTEFGIVLKKVEVPSVEEFQERVRERAKKTDVSLEEVSELVHEYRGIDD